jgi:hypothetical protein
MNLNTLRCSIVGLGILTVVLLTSAEPGLRAQDQPRRVPLEYSSLSCLTNNAAAVSIITNLLAEPQPQLSVPQVAQGGAGPAGTFWLLKNPSAPLPVDPFAELPCYQIGADEFLIDDRSVDYAALDAQQSADEAEQLTNQTLSPFNIDTNGLCIAVPTNSLTTPGWLAINLKSTFQGQSYDILTKASLTDSWAMELTVTGAVGGVTPAQVPRNNRTNLFVWARTSTANSFYLTTQPLSQDVWVGDTVTFEVATGGNTNVSYQWTFNGVPIPGATNASYTIGTVVDNDAGYYACLISCGSDSLLTAAGQLTTEGQYGDGSLMPVVGSRRDYTFKGGQSYYVGSPLQLYGNTTLEAGAVLKFDFDTSTNSSLVILGTLTCDTEAYNPAILTSIDDDSAGTYYFFSDDWPQAMSSGIAYLDLTGSASVDIRNLRFCYADWGVTTPVNAARLEVRDCQFVQCNYGIVNLVAGHSTNRLHNVLFAKCEAALGASSNSITIEGEQVTADVTDFCRASATPSLIALTNSIVWGNALSAAALAKDLTRETTPCCRTVSTTPIATMHSNG